MQSRRHVVRSAPLNARSSGASHHAFHNVDHLSDVLSSELGRSPPVFNVAFLEMNDIALLAVVDQQEHLGKLFVGVPFEDDWGEVDLQAASYLAYELEDP
jgi:hypothetical protein